MTGVEIEISMDDGEANTQAEGDESEASPTPRGTAASGGVRASVQGLRNGKILIVLKLIEV